MKRLKDFILNIPEEREAILFQTPLDKCDPELKEWKKFYIELTSLILKVDSDMR